MTNKVCASDVRCQRCCSASLTLITLQLHFILQHSDTSSTHLQLPCLSAGHSVIGTTSISIKRFALTLQETHHFNCRSSLFGLSFADDLCYFKSRPSAYITPLQAWPPVFVLPREMRDNVYSYCMHRWKSSKRYSSTNKAVRSHTFDCQTFETTLFLLNRKITQECHYLFISTCPNLRMMYTTYDRANNTDPLPKPNTDLSQWMLQGFQYAHIFLGMDFPQASTSASKWRAYVHVHIMPYALTN